MSEQDQQPKFPEAGVDNLIKDFGKKPTKADVDAIEALARKLQPQYEKVERARKVAEQQPKQDRKLGKRI